MSTVTPDDWEAEAARGRWFFGGAVNPRDKDVTVTEAGDDLVFAGREGLTFHDDWDNIGQRLTESGGVTLDGVRTPWSSGAGHVDKVFQSRTYNTLNVPTIQLVFVNFYFGIAGGALETAAAYTREKTRSWLHDDPDAVTEQSRGDFEVRVAAVKARGHRRVPVHCQPRLRGDRRPLHDHRRRPRPVLAQRAHPPTRHPTTAPQRGASRRPF